MSITLVVSPQGRLFVEPAADEREAAPPEAAAKRISAAFGESSAAGLLHLATTELQTSLPSAWGYFRDFARDYLTKLCHRPAQEGDAAAEPLPPPASEALAAAAWRVPPLPGAEYVDADTLARWWQELDELVRGQMARVAGGPAEYLRNLNPLWRLVGRVTFHLAENKRDADYPFAFLATFAHRLSEQAKLQHLPLGRALQEYAGARDRQTLVALLSPVRRAADRSPLVKELVESEAVFHSLAWTPREAYRFLQEIPLLEESGVIVRVPDWWKPERPPRPVVSVKIGDRKGTQLGADTLLDFNVGVALEGESLTAAELNALLNSAEGLVRLKGRWVEVDRDKLKEALQHWKEVERASRDGLSFYEGMRLLAGAPLPGDTAEAAAAAVPEWTGIAAGESLSRTLAELSDPHTKGRPPAGLQTVLRPYQQAGVEWLRFMTRLGLGACLADDMGLGKTVQVIALLLWLRADRAKAKSPASPSLLVVPASLLGNWKSELSRFAPSLVFQIVHPSEESFDEDRLSESNGELPRHDLVITTYGMLGRLAALRKRRWNLAILDEAQAIKNSGSRQTRAVKEVQARCRLTLTGTPVENRLSDLWSLFDFLNPGLLGGPKDFGALAKRMGAKDGPGYAPLRSLVRPYILRRLKTDKSIIRDLPDKTEINAYCGLTKRQAALYARGVDELRQALDGADGIRRRGIVLASLMRFKQICNHPAQLTGDGDYDAEQSDKFRRLGEVCEELAERRQKVLVFTQFREIVGPIAEFLAGVFGRPGLVLHGQTPVGKRRQLVQDFQRDEGPPFFVLSLKAGGTGLNLTAASHVIHFDRWWNPAVENQATDRAFRIGQKSNVLVQKFVCRGTVEERIDELIAQKSALSRELLDGGAETLLTEMSDQELLRFVGLDIRKATET